MRASLFTLLCLLIAGVWLIVPGSVTPARAAVAIDVVQENGGKKSVDFYSSSYALVIGIDDYTNGWPRLSNAVKDAEAVGEALTKRGFDVTLKTNLNRRDLIDALRAFFIVKGDDPNARLLLWFAGHGHTENDEGFIIPADGAAPEKGLEFRLSAIPMRDFSTYVRLAQSKHVMSIFDSCFSGTVFDTQRSIPPKSITMASLRPVRQFLSSGDAFQQVSDDGTFRELFIGALNGEEDADLNRDGFVTGTELGLFMTNRMTNLTEGRQTPRYGKLRDKDYDGGDFVFASLRPRPPQPETGQQAITPQAPKYSQEMETVFWTSIQGSDDWQDYQSYIDQFGAGGAFTALAARRIEKLKAADTQEPQATRSARLPAVEPPETAPATDAREAQWKSTESNLGLSRAERMDIQQALTAIGHPTNGVDGVFGRNSRTAISAYQRTKGLEPTGYLDADLRRTILAEAPPPKQPDNNTQAAVSVPEIPAGNPYDGRWKATVHSITGCRDNKTKYYSFTVTHGVIDEPHQRLPKKGTVSADGKFRIKVFNPDGRARNIQKGTLSGNTGKGRFAGIKRGCGGVISIKRIG